MIVVTVLAWIIGLWIFYLAYCALWVAHRNGKLKAAPLLVQGLGWSVILVALVLDVAFNFIVGSIVFLELPSVRRPTFTQRCKKWKDRDGYRARLANWVCKGWLNPFQEEHC